MLLPEADQVVQEGLADDSRGRAGVILPSRVKLIVKNIPRNVGALVLEEGQRVNSVVRAGVIRQSRARPCVNRIQRRAVDLVQVRGDKADLLVVVLEILQNGNG